MGSVVPATLGERSNGTEPTVHDLFQVTLASAGFSLAEGEASHTLARDITAFGRCCFKAFNRKDEAVTAFMEGFEEYVAEHENLLKCLRPWVSVRDGAAGARSFYAQQDTLIKLLLGVDHVQTQVLECLVGKMAEHAEDTEADATDSVPRLCLTQIRWLDRVKDCPKLVGSLLEVMQLLSADMQREIIECFPEIIDDRQHDDVVENLLEQMDANSALLPPVLDALSNLNLESELMATVQHKVMPKLKSAELQVLPLLVKFLLQTASAGPESASVLSGIRELDVTALRVGVEEGDDAMASERASAESLVIESLRGGFRCNFAITHVVLKELEKTETHATMDVWMLLVLHSLPGHRPKVQATCRKKAKKGALTAEIIRRAVAASASALREYFSDALELAGTLTRDSNPTTRRCGCSFYLALFATFEEDFHRQEVLQSLITHTGSASGREVDCALAVARELSAKGPLAGCLRRHLQFVQNIMDYMEAFSDEQIRTLYTIFANLSLSAMRSTGSMPMDDQIHILLRKQLGHPDVVYKRMGILGATAMVACFGAVEQLPEGGAEEAGQPSPSAAAAGADSSISVELLKYIEDMLEMVFKNCEGQAGCLAFAYDELSLAFEHSQSSSSSGKIDERILNNIFERVSEDFEGGYLLDLGDDAELQPAPMPDLSLKGQAWMNLDQMNAVIVLNVMPLAASAVTKEREQLTTLCSLFRLLVTTTRLSTGSVEDIDAVLGCPLYMMAASTPGGPPPATEYYDSIKIFDSTFRTFFTNLPRREKELVTKCVFITTNWTRELLNGFCMETSDEMKVKTRQRLRDLVSLERKLDICLELHPNANLPNLNQPLGTMMSDGGAGVGRAKRGAPKKKKKTAKDDGSGGGGGGESTQSGSGASPTQPSTAGGRSAAAAADNSGGPRKLSHYHSLGKPLMREMLLCSSLMLAHTEDLVRIHEDTETQEPVQQVISLVKEPRLMHYVLVELLEKIKFITRKTDKAGSPFGGGGGSGAGSSQQGCFPGLCRLEQHTAVTTLMPVLKSLRQHLVDLGDAAAGTAGAAGAAGADSEPDRISDIVFDDEESVSEADAQYYSESIVLLAQCLHELLRCEDLHTVPENRALLCQVLRSLAKYPEHLQVDYADPHVFVQAAYDAFTVIERYAGQHNQKNFAVASEFVPLLNQINVLAHKHVEDEDEARSLLNGKAKLSTRLSVLAGLFLETPWGEIKKLNKDSLSRMLRVHLSEAKDPVQEMANKLSAVQNFQATEKRNKLARGGGGGGGDEGEGGAGERGEAMLPTLNSATLSTYIKTLMEEVPSQLSRLSERTVCRAAGVTPEESLEQLQQVVGFFKALLSMTRAGGSAGAKLQGNAVLKGLLRVGKSVVDIFAKKWLPLLEEWFVSHQSEISDILKAFQKGTRQLQIICSHGKANQELSIASLVPATKKSLETVIYRVKLMLENTKVGDGSYVSAFGQGNLKHRELDGREVSSQHETYGSESEEDDDEDEDESESDGDDDGREEADDQ